MPDDHQKSGFGGWLKSHHVNRIAWILIVAGVVFAAVMFLRMS